jgi:hypothetical protein
VLSSTVVEECDAHALAWKGERNGETSPAKYGDAVT